MKAYLVSSIGALLLFVLTRSEVGASPIPIPSKPVNCIQPNSSIDGEAAELTAKETINVPTNFIPTGPTLELWIPEDSNGLDSVIDIVGLMRTAVKKSSAKQFSNWVGRLRSLDVWKWKHIPAGKSEGIQDLKGEKLVERKELIKKVVEKHNKGTWFKPERELKEEIEKGLHRSRTIVRPNPLLVAGNLEDEDGVPVTEVTHEKTTIKVPKVFIPEVRLWIPADRNGLDSFIEIIGLMRTALERSSAKQFSNWVGKLRLLKVWKWKQIPAGNCVGIQGLTGDKLKDRKELIKKVVKKHNEGTWFKPMGQLKRDIENRLKHPVVSIDAAPSKVSHQIQPSLPQINPGGNVVLSGGQNTPCGRPTAYKGHGASYTTQWSGNVQAIGGHQPVNMHGFYGGIDDTPPMISASSNHYSTPPHTSPYQEFASEIHHNNRIEANLPYHSSFGQPLLHHAGPSSGIPTGGLPVYDNHRPFPMIQGAHNSIPALPLNLDYTIPHTPLHHALTSQIHTNPHVEVDHPGDVQPFLGYQLYPIVHTTDMSVIPSQHEHGQNGTNDQDLEHTLMTMEGQQNHTGGALLGAFSGQNMSYAAWNMDFGHVVDHSHDHQHNGYDIGVLMGGHPAQYTYDHNQLPYEEEHTPHLQ
ncbi:hypothetical protein H0H93_000615 [Arthromyces matolae]|nr:hypothetical protein H0H93_000615 [Arthromyces matolae]